MALAGTTLFIAGPPDLLDEETAFDAFAEGKTQARLAEQAASLAGKKGAMLVAVSAADGKTLAQLKLAASPAWDGMAAAGGKLYLSTTDGKILCLGGK